MTTTTQTAKISQTHAKMKLPMGTTEVIIRDSDIAGFHLRIRATSRRYLYAGRVSGTKTRRTITLGDAATITSAQARTAAMSARSDMMQGIDPVAAAARSDGTPAFADFAIGTEPAGAAITSYMDHWVRGQLPKQSRPPRPPSIGAFRTDLARAVEAFGDIPIGEIDRAKVQMFYNHLQSEQVGGAVRRRAWQAFKQVMNFAVTRGIVETNHARDFDNFAGADPRTRRLSPDELHRVWHAAGDMGTYGRLVRFLIAVPVRLSIATALTHTSVDTTTQSIRVAPEAKGNKARLDAIVPLTRQAFEITQNQNTAHYVFEGQRGLAISTNRQRKDRLNAAADIYDWRLHDLRRTTVSLLADHYIDHDADAADRWLMHRRAGVMGNYNTSQRVHAQRIVANQWADLLDRIIDGQDISTNIIPLNKATGT